MKRMLALALALLLLASAAFPASAAAGTDMSPSKAALQFIANQEGFRAYAHASGGHYYIGYGTQIKSGQYPNGISREKALELLEKDVSSYTYLVNQFAHKHSLTFTQYQFDALVSLSYNISTKWMKTDSSLCRLLLKGSYTDVELMQAMGSWCHAGGTALSGLCARRICEAKMFLYGDYGDLNYLFYYADTDAELSALREELQTLRGTWAAQEVGLSDSGLGAEETEVLTEGEYLTQETALLEKIAACQAAIDAEPGPVYGENAAKDFTYVRYDGGKGTENDDIIYYAKGQPYGELGSASRTGYRLAAWEKKDGSYLLPTDTASSACAVTAVWTTGTVNRAYLTTSPFGDVSIYAWYYDSLLQASKAGIVSGYANGNFYPQDSVTVGALLKMVLLSAGYGEQPSADGSAFGGYRALALKKGFVSAAEVSDLSVPATRLLAARLAATALGLEKSEDVSPYADVSDPLATALYATGIMVGSSENGKTVLLADKQVRRLEMAVIVSRMLQYREDAQ